MIEVVLAMAILSLLVTAIAPISIGRDPDARIRSFRKDLVLWDRQARLAAIAGTPLVLAGREDGSALVVRELGSAKLRATLPAPSGWTVWAKQDNGASPVLFDRRGETPDYEVVLQCEELSWRVAVEGATGRLREEQEPWR